MFAAVKPSGSLVMIASQPTRIADSFCIASSMSLKSESGRRAILMTAASKFTTCTILCTTVSKNLIREVPWRRRMNVAFPKVSVETYKTTFPSVANLNKPSAGLKNPRLLSSRSRTIFRVYEELLHLYSVSKYSASNSLSDLPLEKGNSVGPSLREVSSARASAGVIAWISSSVG